MLIGNTARMVRSPHTLGKATPGRDVDVLRIHFTTEDLARVRIASHIDPMWELVLSLHQLRRPGPVGPDLDTWRRTVHSEHRGQLAEPVRLLQTLVPPRGYFPDFLTPAEGRHGIDAGIDAALSTPRARLRSELGRVAAERGLSAWDNERPDRNAARLRRLGGALRDYHRYALEPHLATIGAPLYAERSRLAALQAEAGVEGLLRGLRPIVSWRAPVLEALYPYPRHHDIHLNGRGLTLIPSFFCRDAPVALADVDLDPVLVYPALHVRSSRSSAGALAALLGRTRAAVLLALSTPCTTTGLAARVGISPASASEHALVLRNAGLVHTHRDGRWVVHNLTPLGHDVLNGRP